MSIVFKIAKKIIVLLFGTLIAFIIGLLLWRVFSSGDPASMKVLSVNEALSSAYSTKGEELYIFRQEQRSITSGESNYGYFSVTDCVIIPEANQIQTVLRYNNSTLRSTEKDYGLESNSLTRDGELYEVSLVLAIDLTPENTEDNLGNDENSVRFVRCHGTLVASDTTRLYNYRRTVFQLDDAQIDIKQLIDDGLLLAVYEDICYVGDINYDKPYGTLCLYDYISENIAVKLDKKDVQALESYKIEN